MDEEWPDEPDEPDPEKRWGSPERDLPRVPAAPEAPSTAPESDVDPELLSTWWHSVLLANVALGGVAVGLMLVGFRRMWLVGGGAVALGLLPGLRLRPVLRSYRARASDGDDGDDGQRDSAGVEPAEPPRHD